MSFFGARRGPMPQIDLCGGREQPGAKGTTMALDRIAIAEALELAYGEERVEYEICDDCVIWVHNGEEPFDGTPEAARNRQATAAIFSTARGVVEDLREWSTRPCECCGTALHGDRTLYVVSGA